jgi:exodeoxyribonuclease X
MTAIVFDTETTDTRAPEIIEAAWMPVVLAKSGPDLLQFGAPVSRRYRPKGRISMGAMAVHHIMEEDLVDCEPSASFALPQGVAYLIGHNVDFDWVAAGSPQGIKRIDTLGLARKYWPECDSHSLGALAYYLFRPTARQALKSAHSAEADILLTGRLLKEIVRKFRLRIQTFDELWMLSEEARVPEVMPFGKHKGELISRVPQDYKAWLLRQLDVDPYLVRALKK